MANSLLLLAHSAAEAAGEHGAAHAEPTAFGLNPAWYVAASMTVLILFAVFGAKAHKIIGSGLDSSIAEIRKQLDEAKSLRAEAEALRKEYSDKIASAERDAEAMLAHARTEADAIVAKAEADTVDVITRREKMANDKIAAAERAAVDGLRARAADAATRAARGLIADNHTAVADKALVDQAIGSI
jgi:F-type H+-transporting ATPase subunit b